MEVSSGMELVFSDSFSLPSLIALKTWSHHLSIFCHTANKRSRDDMEVDKQSKVAPPKANAGANKQEDFSPELLRVFYGEATTIEPCCPHHPCMGHSLDL